MSWTISYSSKALKDFKKLDTQARYRIKEVIESKIATLENPRSLGKALAGQNIWRYRVGDYRILADIRDNELIILIIKAGHRKAIYTNKG